MIRKIVFGILRVWLGWQWLSAGWNKINSPVWTGDKAGVAVSGFLRGSIAKASGDYPEVHGWYASFAENIALPNAKIFGFMVAYGEFFLGIALLLGAFTLFAALGSIFLNLNYLFAGTSSSNPEMLIIGIIILLFFISAGYYGLDYYINPILIKYYNKVVRFLKDKGILSKDFPEKTLD